MIKNHEFLVSNDTNADKVQYTCLENVQNKIGLKQGKQKKKKKKKMAYFFEGFLFKSVEKIKIPAGSTISFYVKFCHAQLYVHVISVQVGSYVSHNFSI